MLLFGRETDRAARLLFMAVRDDQFDEVRGSIEEIDKKLVEEFNPKAERLFKIGGFIALGVGLTLIALILISMIFAYK